MRRRVLFLSGREVGYIRNRVLLSALREHFDVAVCTVDGRNIPARVLAGLLRFVTHRPDYDVCFAGFYGQPVAIALSLLQRKPIILDAYVSTYDTLCEDRRLFRPRSAAGHLAHWLDQRSCHRSARVLTDTQAHARYFTETFAVPESKLAAVYVGCDEALFYPRDEVTPALPSTSTPSVRYEVFYYASFLPLHGTEIVVQAAARLRHRPEIRFTLGGDGVRRTAVQQMIAELALPTVDLADWIPFEQLPGYIARASVCLGGHFSTVPKAARVVSTKTFQFVAMRKPTVVGDNPAVREIFVPGESVYAVPMGDPAALAQAIETLVDDGALRARIANGGYDVFQRQLTTRVLADQLLPIVDGA